MNNARNEIEIIARIQSYFDVLEITPIDDIRMHAIGGVRVCLDELEKSIRNRDKQCTHHQIENENDMGVAEIGALCIGCIRVPFEIPGTLAHKIQQQLTRNKEASEYILRSLVSDLEFSYHRNEEKYGGSK